jgi:hypothetical protein
VIETTIPDEFSEEKKIKIIALDLAVQHCIGFNHNPGTSGRATHEHVVNAAKAFEKFITEQEIKQ